MDEIKKEYERIKDVFKDSDGKTLQLLDGLILEAARTRVELDKLHRIEEHSGLVVVHPSRPEMQKEMPVARVLPKVRASYTNIMFKLSKSLNNQISDDDLGLDDYE